MYGRRTVRRGLYGAFGSDPVATNQGLESGSGGGFWKALGAWLLGEAKEQGEKLLEQGSDKLLSAGSGSNAVAAAAGDTSKGPLVLTSRAGNVSTTDLMGYRPLRAGGVPSDAPTLPGGPGAMPSTGLLPWWGWVAVVGGVVYVAAKRR